MSDFYLGQLLLVPYNFAPKGWAFCAGQLLSISQNTALFSLIGTYFGGNGQTTFGLPDLQGRIPIGTGQGPGLSPYDLGEQAGVPSVTLNGQEMPMHTHTPVSVSGRGFAPASNPLSQQLADGVADYAPAASVLNSTLVQTQVVGSTQAHNNMMPYLTLNWCIALQGVFPQRP